mmetsp:Transcript_6176/g.11855  ORF Transcript_6176/g.11855 Transcript_6176/m.11855 type:complete len:221 (+) Transcript_6176:238-900(+)
MICRGPIQSQLPQPLPVPLLLPMQLVLQDRRRGTQPRQQGQLRAAVRHLALDSQLLERVLKLLARRVPQRGRHPPQAEAGLRVGVATACRQSPATKSAPSIHSEAAQRDAWIQRSTPHIWMAELQNSKATRRLRLRRLPPVATSSQVYRSTRHGCRGSLTLPASGKRHTARRRTRISTSGERQATAGCGTCAREGAIASSMWRRTSLHLFAQPSKPPQIL